MGQAWGLITHVFAADIHVVLQMNAAAVVPSEVERLQSAAAAAGPWSWQPNDGLPDSSFCFLSDSQVPTDAEMPMSGV
jgi:hypothetical protein